MKVTWVFLSLFCATVRAQTPIITLEDQECVKPETYVVIQANIYKYKGDTAKCTYSYSAKPSKKFETVILTRSSEQNDQFWGVIPSPAKHHKVKSGNLKYSIEVTTASGKPVTKTGKISIQEHCGFNKRLDKEQEDAQQSAQKLFEETHKSKGSSESKYTTRRLTRAGVIGLGAAGLAYGISQGIKKNEDPTVGNYSLSVSTTTDNELGLSLSESNPLYNQSISIPADQNSVPLNLELGVCIELIGNAANSSTRLTQLSLSFQTQTDPSLFQNWNINSVTFNGQEVTASVSNSQSVVLSIPSSSVGLFTSSSGTHPVRCPAVVTLSINGTVNKSAQ